MTKAQVKDIIATADSQKPFSEGVDSSAYLIDDKYIVTIKKENTSFFNSQKKMKQISDELREKGVDTPEIYFTGKVGGRQVCIQEYVEGNSVFLFADTKDIPMRTGMGEYASVPSSDRPEGLNNLTHQHNIGMSKILAHAPQEIFDKFLQSMVTCYENDCEIDTTGENFRLGNNGIKMIDLPDEKCEGFDDPHREAFKGMCYVLTAGPKHTESFEKGRRDPDGRLMQNAFAETEDPILNKCIQAALKMNIDQEIIIEAVSAVIKRPFQAVLDTQPQEKSMGEITQARQKLNAMILQESKKITTPTSREIC